MAGAVGEATDGSTSEDMQRLKDMLAELNAMLAQRARGEEPDFAGFMERYGDFFPENPKTLDELLEVMGPPHGRRPGPAQLDDAGPAGPAPAAVRPAAGRHGPQLAGQRAGRPTSATSSRTSAGIGATNSAAVDPLDFSHAADMLAELGDIDQLENLLRGSPSPGALAEVDADAVRRLLGDDSAESLERMAEVARMLEEAGLIENREGRFDLTPRAIRKIGQGALRDLFAKLDADKLGRHAIHREGLGHEREPDTKPYEYGDPFNLHHRSNHPQRRDPHRRRGAGASCTPTTSRLSAPSSRCDQPPC